MRDGKGECGRQQVPAPHQSVSSDTSR
jgi:hypothetical protein